MTPYGSQEADMHIDSEHTETYDVVTPQAGALIESLRAFGYSPQTAIADLIDNSITAEAGNVWLTFQWNGSESWVAVADDGYGMTEQELIDAMRAGSQHPLVERDPRDLGRFGLGLKTASFSQCRNLTVASKTKCSDAAIRRWDLDYVNETGEWRLLRTPTEMSPCVLTGLEDHVSGTVVVWETLDRIVGNAKASDEMAHRRFLEMVARVESHVAMVFHRYLEGRGRINIWINGHKVEPWDPYLTNEPTTQLLAEEALELFGKSISIRPYVLPHQSNVSKQIHDDAAGPAGWNAQQGFYVYRNRRMLVPGGWLGLGYRQEEHYKLARILVDIPNSMDQEWDIDVKKSVARPPMALRDRLRNIAKITRTRAQQVYRHRGKVIARRHSQEHVYLWERKISRGKLNYSVNRQHPLVKSLLSAEGEVKTSISALLRLIEETLPVEQIWIDSAENTQERKQPFEGDSSRQVINVMEQVYRSLLLDGMTPTDARARLMVMEPFNHFPELVVALAERNRNGENYRDE